MTGSTRQGKPAASGHAQRPALRAGDDPPDAGPGQGDDIEQIRKRLSLVDA